jgi:hypothetical protein
MSEPRTAAERDLCDVLYHSEFHISREQANISGRLMYDAMLARGYRIEAEAAVPASPDVVELAQIIREEDGDHSLGAGTLAERIVARLPADKPEPSVQAQPAGLDVWAVVVGNYFPREVEAIYLHEADAVRHADEHDGRDVVKWTVAAAYAEGEPE